MNRRKLVCAIASLGAVAGCTSINDVSSGGSTPTAKQEPCEPPTSEPADVVQVSDSSLSLQEIRKETDAYPNHEAGAVGIYEGRDGGQLVLGAYRFNSPTDAQSAADQRLNPEPDVVAQLQVGRWLLLSQAPEKEKSQSLVLSAGVSEGCQSELTFFGIQTGDTFRLGSGNQPWQGTIVDLKGGSPSEIRASLDSPVPAILRGETVHTVYVETEDYEGLQRSLDQSGFEVIAINQAAIENLPVCEIRSRIRLPGRVSESEVREAFSNHVRIVMSTPLSGGRQWMIYSRLHSSSDISNRLDKLQVAEDQASVHIYSGCSVDK